ncbi:MAG: rhodanese-like domain-containing protein [Opitutaceae bacterium]|nr:rhodanese-like domain-containing protein [Opitutaceae bacterium]
MKTLGIALAVIAALIVFSLVSRGQMLDPAEALQRVESGQAVLIDVREPAEWAATGVAAPAALLPLSDLKGDRREWTPYLEAHRGKELILYCRSGNRSGIAGRILAKEGWTVANGGAFKTWQAAGLPVRQVESK